MRILLSNDDGYFAPGLTCLADELSEIAEIIVVAPERDRSGSSNSLTLDRPLSLRKSHNGFYYVNGTGMLDVMPDMIISGVNSGANMGDDTIYSGTVAAATEGFLLGIPSLAVSLAGSSNENYLTAARVAADMVIRFREKDIQSPFLLNINVPDIEYQNLEGVEVTRLGRRHKAEPVIKSKSPRGENLYWVGAAGAAQDAGKGTDFYAIQHNRVSVTPLQIDLTRYDQLDLITRWLDI